MSGIGKINRVIQIIRNAILNFQFEQVNKIINSICEFSALQQFLLSFTIVILYKAFNKIPDKIKLKLNLVPSKKVENESPYNLPYHIVNNYTDNLPFYRKIIVADLYYFRT